MNLELLPNEIILDVFDYFNGIDLLHAFYGLNYRFNFLLYKQFRLFRFKFDLTSKRKFDIIFQQHLPFIADRIIALSLSDIHGILNEINLFLTYTPSLKHFTHLRALSLSNLNSEETLMKIVDECHHLDHLTHLKFDSCTYSNNNMFSKSITDKIWSLPKLNTHENSDTNVARLDYFRIPTKISSSIERLSLLKCCIELDQIYQLFEYTPRLKHLSLIVVKCRAGAGDYVPCSLPTLISLNIHIPFVCDHSQIICLLQNMPNLRLLNIDLGSNVIDGHTWKQLISNYLPKLKTFQVSMNYELRFNQNKQQQKNVTFDSFRSSFWIDERRWFIQCLTWGTTVYLHTPSKTLPYYHYRDSFPDSFISTQPADDLKKSCNDMTETIHGPFSNPPIPSYIRLTNIKDLQIGLSINDSFRFICPGLNRLHSHTVRSNIDASHPNSQASLDRAPHLYSIFFFQDGSIPFKMAFSTWTNPSLRELRFDQCFNEEECMRLARSQLGIQCERLFIHVTNSKSIVYLVKNMISLRFLDVIYDSRYCKHLSQTQESPNENMDKLVQWLKDRLLATRFIVKNSKCYSEIKIWI